MSPPDPEVRLDTTTDLFLRSPSPTLNPSPVIFTSSVFFHSKQYTILTQEHLLEIHEQQTSPFPNPVTGLTPFPNPAPRPGAHRELSLCAGSGQTCWRPYQVFPTIRSQTLGDLGQSQCFTPDFGSSSLRTWVCLRVLVQMHQVAHPARKGEDGLEGWPMQKPILWLKSVLLSGHVGREESSSQVPRCSLGFWQSRRGQAPPCCACCNAYLMCRASALCSGHHKPSLGLLIFSVPAASRERRGPAYTNPPDL